MKVLIADDSAFMRAILKDIVAKSNWSGAQVIEAADGKAAVEKFKAEAPDLVLLDVVMPEQDGIAVLKEIGHNAKSVVIVSSVDQNAVINEAKGLGAKDYIMKPFDASKVLEVLNALLPQGS
ncbi:MAG TPA: response regulator [Candidatus Saccharimonadales bacterium]|nr:response regulator [Candidatus Saccharimonadales bacterium]